MYLDSSSVPFASKHLVSSSSSVKLHSRVPACGPLLRVWVPFLSCRDTRVCLNSWEGDLSLLNKILLLYSHSVCCLYFSFLAGLR